MKYRYGSMFDGKILGQHHLSDMCSAYSFVFHSSDTFIETHNVCIDVLRWDRDGTPVLENENSVQCHNKD